MATVSMTTAEKRDDGDETAGRRDEELRAKEPSTCADPPCDPWSAQSHNPIMIMLLWWVTDMTTMASSRLHQNHIGPNVTHTHTHTYVTYILYMRASPSCAHFTVERHFIENRKKITNYLQNDPIFISTLPESACYLQNYWTQITSENRRHQIEP